MCARPRETRSPRTRYHADRFVRFFAIPLLFLATQAPAQWTTQSPVPTFLDVRGVAAPTAQRVFLATADTQWDNGGALFESADGGSTWAQRNLPVSLEDPLNGIFFRDDQNGWIYGNANYRTTDGGTTWNEMPFFGTTYFMKFYTASFGSATAGASYVSQDSGSTWIPSPNDMFAFEFFDDLTGLGLAGNAIYRTTDGGAGWTQVLTGAPEAVAFLTSSVVVGIVDDSFVRSTDGGVNWTVGDPADGRRRLLAVTADAVLAWARAEWPYGDARVFRSADAGQTWTDLGEVMGPGFYAAGFAFAIPSAPNVVASDGAGKVYRSSDAGATWTSTFDLTAAAPGTFGIPVPSFPDALTGYFAFGPGFAIKTTDGGASWTQISSGSGLGLNDIDRFPNGDMIAVGDDGTLVTSAGGAMPWILHEKITTYDIEAVHAFGPGEVAAVDEVGQVFLSSDGGATWTATAAKPTNLGPAEDIHFNTLLDGWVIGQGFAPGVVWHTTDGGATWTPVSGFAGAYVAGDFEGANGWAANVTGLFYRTTDGGANWVSGNVPGSSLQIRDMDFFDENVGYAVGWNGYAARSDDGGVTWNVLPTPAGADQFTDLYLLGPDEFWASTNDGVAYYSATGGQTWSELNIGSQGFGTFAAIAANATGDAWTAGFQGYIEHFAGPPPPPLNQPPTAAFTYIAAGLTVNFTDTSTDIDGTIVGWLWDFDDGTFSTEQNPTHVFQTADTYWVGLTAIDDDGDSSETMAIITVQPLPGGTFGDFTEVTPLDSLFWSPQNEDFWVASSAPADYDGDGDLDIAVLGYYVVYNTSVEHRLVLIRNDGLAAPGEWEFSYIDVPIGTLSSGASDLAWGDVDGDGDQDLVVGTNGQTVIYRNDAGTLVMTDTVLPNYREDNDQAEYDLTSITWADYDNDGDLDLLLPSIWNDTAYTYRTALMRNDGPNGTGGWNFAETDSVFAPTYHAQSAWADYDGDQDLDLLLSHLAPLTNDGFIRRYRNDGGGVFVGEDILDSLTVEHGQVQWGDYDADGDLDILTAGLLGDLGGFYLTLRIYRNDAETYVPIDIITCPFCEGWWDLTAATWADYDSDGDMDILLAGNYNSGSNIEGRAQIYANDGTGNFSVWGDDLPAPRASGSPAGSFTWLDLDEDGDLDYFIAGMYFVPGGNGSVESQMHVYRNDVQGVNGPPSAPLNLAAAVDDSTGTALLTWNAASDDKTAVPALTYDLDLYRNGVPVASPRRLPEPGNVSAGTSWTLTGLPDGAYAWKLRAVDSAYNGGPSSTGGFAIGVATDVDDADVLPRVYALAENRPNPFNPSTTIRFALPERIAVTLNVYDLSGRLVMRLVDETMPAGNHEIRWNAGDMASGVYFVRLSAGGFTRTQRAVLLK